MRYVTDIQPCFDLQYYLWAVRVFPMCELYAGDVLGEADSRIEIIIIATCIRPTAGTGFNIELLRSFCSVLRVFLHSKASTKFQMPTDIGVPR